MTKDKHITIQFVSRPPIVAVLGHVDHGKTTLLDTISKTTIASHEHGGITQRIGAYQVKVKSQSSKVKDNSKKKQNIDDGLSTITFIDTPGHEAFAKMRSRGASVADIAILVVAADDSVKPQTIESIRQIISAGASMIVAVNKIDVPTANIERVKQDLAKYGVQVEGFGGDIPIVQISAKVGTGVDELLDLILLVSQMKELKSEPEKAFEAVVVETRLDKGKGMVATVIVKTGTLRPGISLFEGATQVAKVRAMFDEHEESVREALPSMPVEILGFTVAPSIGSVLTSEPVVKVSSEFLEKTEVIVPASAPGFLDPIDPNEKERLNLIVKADTAGSLEAILVAFSRKITIVSHGIGDITERDVLAARSSKALVVGFNVKASPSVEKLAVAEKVIIRIYKIIYELLEELAEVVLGLKEVLVRERELGVGQIIAEFPYEGQRVAGTKVVEGRLARGDSVKIMHSENGGEKSEFARAKIKSIRRGKEDSNKAEEGTDCGVLLDRTVDFHTGDAIIAFTTG